MALEVKMLNVVVVLTEVNIVVLSKM